MPNPTILRSARVFFSLRVVVAAHVAVPRTDDAEADAAALAEKGNEALAELTDQNDGEFVLPSGVVFCETEDAEPTGQDPSDTIPAESDDAAAVRVVFGDHDDAFLAPGVAEQVVAAGRALLRLRAKQERA